MRLQKNRVQAKTPGSEHRPLGAQGHASPSSFLSMVSCLRNYLVLSSQFVFFPLRNLLAFPQILGYSSSSCACQLDRPQKLQHQPLFTDSLENKDPFAVFLNSLKP